MRFRVLFGGIITLIPVLGGILFFIPQPALADCCYMGVGNCYVMNPDFGDCPGNVLRGDCPQNCSGETPIQIAPSLPAQTSPEQKPLYFKLNMGIPGSAQFNGGRDILLTGATLGEYIAAFYIFFVGAMGIFATVMMIWGGVKYVTAFGSQQRISAARDQITSALLGLLITLSSYVLLLTINPNLVKFTGLGLPEVVEKTQQEERALTSEKGAPPLPVDWSPATVGNVTTYDGMLTSAASRYGIDRNWLKALMLIESNGDPNAQSSAGACGLIQLLPSTADRYDDGRVNNSITCDRLKDPATNIDIAAHYLRDLLVTTCPTKARYKSGAEATCHPEQTQCTNGSYHYAAAAYNGGVGANCSSISCPGLTWWECEVNTGYAETREYVYNKAWPTYQRVTQFNWGQ